MSRLFIAFVFSTTRQPASANQRLLHVKSLPINTRHYLRAAVALCLDELVLYVHTPYIASLVYPQIRLRITILISIKCLQECFISIGFPNLMRILDWIFPPIYEIKNQAWLPTKSINNRGEGGCRLRIWLNLGTWWKQKVVYGLTKSRMLM
jgi:hypothetical protein